MKIKPFELERYFAKYEFSAPYLLSPSDCEPLTLEELLSFADLDSLNLWENLRLGYTESQGLPKLREEVAKLYKTVESENVLIAAPEECIFVAMNAFLEKGDHIITTFPGYQSLYQVAESIGCSISRWIPKEEDVWNFDILELKKLINSKTKMIVINFPHNPTGAMLSQKQYTELFEIAKKNNIRIFSDEMYRFLEYADSDRLDSACDMSNNAISLFGVSKSFALAGLRIGWLVTKDKELMQKMLEFKDYTTICSSAPSEILALMALRVKDEIIQRNMQIINHNLSVLWAFLAKRNGLIGCIEPQAGTVCFPRLISKINIDDFCQRAVEKSGVMVVPSSVYGYSGNNFRIGLGRKNFPEIMKHFSKFFDEFNS